MGRPLPARLEQALEGVGSRPSLDVLVRERFGSSIRLKKVSSKVVRRRVVRYGVSTDGDPPRTWSVIGKVYDSPEAGQHAFRILRLLEEAGFSAAAPQQVRVPRALAYDEKSALLLMEEAGGTSLKRLLKKGLARDEEARAFAEALLKLHGFPRVIGATFTVADHLRVRCAGLTPALAEEFPAAAPTIERIIATAEREQERQERWTLCHGDYHPGQVHLDEDTTWILDLDPLHRGDPAYDLGLVFTVLKRLESDRPRRWIRVFRDAFVSTYFARIDPQVAARIPLNEALVYLKRACKRFRYRDEAGWKNTVQRELEHAGRCLDVMEKSSVPRNLGDVLDSYDLTRPPARFSRVRPSTSPG